MPEQKKKYELLLLELADVIKAKNDEISLLKIQLFATETRLKEAEGSVKNESECVG